MSSSFGPFVPPPPPPPNPRMGGIAPTPRTTTSGSGVAAVLAALGGGGGSSSQPGFTQLTPAQTGFNVPKATALPWAASSSSSNPPAAINTNYKTTVDPRMLTVLKQVNALTTGAGALGDEMKTYQGQVAGLEDDSARRALKRQKELALTVGSAAERGALTRGGTEGWGALAGQLGEREGMRNAVTLNASLADQAKNATQNMYGMRSNQGTNAVNANVAAGGLAGGIASDLNAQASVANAANKTLADYYTGMEKVKLDRVSQMMNFYGTLLSSPAFRNG